MRALVRTGAGSAQAWRYGVGAKPRSRFSQHACPTALSKDCDAWAPQVQAGIGTLRIAVRGLDGSPPTGATFFLDSVETPLGDGTIEVNAGAHQVRVEAPRMIGASVSTSASGGATTEVEIVLHPRPPGVDTKPTPRPLPVAPFVVGGIGLGVVAAGGALGIVGQVDVANMRATCGKDAQCSPTRVDTVRKEWIAGGALAGVGGGAIVVAVVLFVAERPTVTRATTTFVPVVDLGGRGGTVGFASVFE